MDKANSQTWNEVGGRNVIYTKASKVHWGFIYISLIAI
jgi:hypothetical protein